VEKSVRQAEVRARDPKNGGESLPAVFRSEGAAQSWIKSRVQKDTILNADEAPSCGDL